MIRLEPAAGWEIRFVRRADAENPNPRRPALTLLGRRDSNELILPISSDQFRLVGYTFGLVEEMASRDVWIECSPPCRWLPAATVVVKSFPPLRLEFIDRDESERRRRIEASEAIVEALSPHSTESLMHRASRLEHADRLLDGNSIPIAALLLLMKQANGSKSPALGNVDSLMRRLKSASPSGIGGMSKEFRAIGFERLHEWRPALVSAAEEAFSAADVLDPTRWTALRSQVLRQWWSRLTSGLKRPSPKGEFTEHSSAIGHSNETIADETARIRSEHEMLAELKIHFEETDIPVDVLGSIAAIHQPRIDLFAEQMADLERLLNTTQRLSAWERVRRDFAYWAEWCGRLEDEKPWNRARIAAAKIRSSLGLPADDPLHLETLATAATVRIAAISLPYSQMLGANGTGAGGAPIVGLGPAVLAGDLGVVRFGVAHQIGHLLEGCRYSSTSTCVGMMEIERNEEEAFANAFAVYFLAPRDAVVRVTGHPTTLTDDWLYKASADVAVCFGLSAGAAIAHVMNCLDVGDVPGRNATLRAQGRWLHHRDELRDTLESAWKEDRHHVETDAGHAVEAQVEHALERPRSDAFERLVIQAASERLIDPEVARDLSRVA